MAEQLPAEFTMTADWETPAHATPLADMRAVAEQFMGLGRPLLPLSCDLTGDKIACAILKAWARQPWEPVHRALLLDRMEELDRSEEERAWAQTVGQRWCEGAQATKRLGCTRTHMRLLLKEWRHMLIEHFGDFESKYSL